MKTGVIVLIGLLPIMVFCKEPDHMAAIKDVKRAHEAQWLALPDVASVGIGKDDQGKWAIFVNLVKPNPDTQASLPTHIDGYPLVVRVSGPIKAQ